MCHRHHVGLRDGNQPSKLSYSIKKITQSLGLGDFGGSYARDT